MSYHNVPLERGLSDTDRCNRRATVRYQCAPATPGRVYAANDQEYQRAWVLDLSSKGIGLQMARPLNPGTFLVIRLKSAQGNKVYDLPAHVAHATPLPTGDYLVGCELVRVLDNEDLDELL